MNKDAKIYVAGHTGLVGSALIRKLIAEGYNNIITKNISELDLRRQSEVEAFFERERPEYVFLAAAKVGGILANNTYKAEFIYDNLMIASNVIHASYKYGVKKLLNLGSSCIYPKNCPQPMKEEYLLTGPLEPTNEPYAIAKIAAIKLCRYYNEQYGTNYISVMPTNLYGPNDNFNFETAHVLPALIRKFHLGKLLWDEKWDLILEDLKRFPVGFGLDGCIRQEEHDIKYILEQLGIKKDYILIWGSGRVFREFMHVDDLADACLYIIKNYQYKDIGEIINIGTGNDLTISELSIMIKNIVGYKGDINYDYSKPDGVKRKLLNIEKLLKLNWRNRIKMEDGIKMTYSWYCSY
ncbi:MAG: GDP-L-fucose synthase [Candidatus Omnitrophica bacterium]|nr:GDP-L-fucose synthase [Candidatus Omnitrophota bacterium]